MWFGSFSDIRPGALYRYRLDSLDDHRFPDPASRFQPRGVHGPSQLIDPGAFRWTDESWPAPALDRLVIYELHTGTFTPAGTFDGIAERLPYLARLGVTAIELMPVADFPGRYNWGYDGVALFAPARSYGRPDSLRGLVNAAHRHGLAVIMDVVYNHFGPDGAYAIAFSPYYLSDRHQSPWGAGVNLDGPHSAQVRRFFIENALDWVLDYHVDGLRLDAIHAIVDHSSPHFLAELTSTVRAAAGRNLFIVAEDHRNPPELTEPIESGGYGLDAVWADEFHHQARVHTAHDRDGYYARFSGEIGGVAETLRQAPPARSVICIQNHDQVGNRADGARLHHEIDLAGYRALTVLLLMAPQTPLLFMGQEWAATTPFQYFTDHHEVLGRLVSAGRRAEFAAFERFTGSVPDPQAADTFHRSVLRWDEADTPPHAGTRRLYERLLQLRASHPAMRAGEYGSCEVRVLDDHTLSLERAVPDEGVALLAIVRLSGEGQTRVPVEPGFTRVLFTTEDAEFLDPAASYGIRIPGIEGDPPQARFDRPGALVLSRGSDRR